MKSYSRFILVLLLGASYVQGQDGVIESNSSLQEFLDKQHTAGLLPNAFLTHKPLSGNYIRVLLDSLSQKKSLLNERDRRFLDRYLLPTSSPKPNPIKRILPKTFTYGESLIALHTKDLRLHVNPILDYRLGTERRSGYEDKGERLVWQQTRGVRIAGSLNKGFYFDTRYDGTLLKPYEGNITVDPISTLPRYRAVERSWDTNVDRALYDIPRAIGVAGYTGRYVDIRIGRDTNRWAEGFGSVFLSDYAAEYDQFRMSTKVWKLEYVNLIAAFDNRFRRDDILHTRRKYGAFHSLGINISKRFNITLFESIIFSKDSLGMNKKQIDRPSFDPAYANPVILYQSIEEDLGDLGNATLGAGGYWIPVNGLKIYGQFLLDEFDFSDYTKTASNQWTKKYALLAGFAYTSLPSSTVKLEFSQVRPFTYSHHSGQTSYTHYNDYLGHPLGSNFRDITLWYHWYAPADLNLYLTASYTKRGRNSSINYGGSPLNPYTTRVKDADVQMFDGVTVKELWSEIRLNKELLPNCFIEFNLNLNRIRDAEKGDSIKLVPMIQLRWGQVYRNERY